MGVNGGGLGRSQLVHQPAKWYVDALVDTWRCVLSSCMHQESHHLWHSHQTLHCGVGIACIAKIGQANEPLQAAISQSHHRPVSGICHKPQYS